MGVQRQKIWHGKVPVVDDFGDFIHSHFVDGRTMTKGTWGIFTPQSYRTFGRNTFGIGLGQMYEKQPATGQWVKVKG